MLFTAILILTSAIIIFKYLSQGYHVTVVKKENKYRKDSSNYPPA